MQNINILLLSVGTRNKIVEYFSKKVNIALKKVKYNPITIQIFSVKWYLQKRNNNLNQ